MVHVNGDTTTCCLDEGMKNKLGNLQENSLSEIWMEGKINDWRLAQIEGRFSESGPLCASCNWRSAGALSREDAANWLKSYRRRKKR